MIHPRDGSLFDSGADALVIPVNCVATPGAGLAKEWARRYPLEAARYKKLCRDGFLTPGQCLLSSPVLAKKGKARLVLPLSYVVATKDDWKNPSELGWIANGLKQLRWALDGRGHLKTCAVPALGCGLGGLEWKDVRPLIYEHLKGWAGTAYVYPPKEE